MVSETIFVCIKNLKVVHRYGNIYNYDIGQKVLESTLVRQGTRPDPVYFEIVKEK